MDSVIKFSFDENSCLYLVAKNSLISVLQTYDAKEDAIVKLSRANFKNLISGVTSGRTLFMKGEMKVSGDMSKMMKLDHFTQALQKYSVKSKL